MPTQVYFFTIGISTYTLCIGLAALAGIAAALWQARGSVDGLSQRLTGLLIIAGTAMIAGRAGYVLLHADYFGEHINEVFSAASPGMWEQAAIAGGVIGWLIAWRARRPVPARALVLIASLVGIGASLGCIPAGCAYGREVFWTDGWVWALRADWPDAYMLNNPRLPAQVFMMAWLLLLMLAMIAPQVFAFIRKERPTQGSAPTYKGGAVIALWVALFALGDFMIQFVRADGQQMVAGLRLSQCADAVLFAAGMLNLILVTIRQPTRH